MRSARRLLALQFAFAIALSASTALAEEPTIRERARAAFESGDFPTAGHLFEELNRQSPHASYLFNAALAWDQAGEYARAVDAYEEALRIGGLDKAREDQTGQRLAELNRRVGVVSVPRPIGGTVSVAHITNAPLPAKFHLSPGNYTVVVRSPDGTTTRSTQVVRAGEISTVNQSPGKPKPVREVPPPAPSRVQQPPPPGDSRPTNSSHTWGYVALGGAAALTGAWAYFALDTDAQRSEYDDSGRSNLDARDRGVRSRTFAWITGGAALASGTVGVFLLLSDDETAKPGGVARVDVQLSPTHVAGRLRF